MKELSEGIMEVIDSSPSSNQDQARRSDLRGLVGWEMKRWDRVRSLDKQGRFERVDV